MVMTEELADDLAATFNTMIEAESKPLPTLENPLIVERKGSGIALHIHDCIQKKIDESAQRLNVSIHEAKSAFVYAVLEGLLPKTASYTGENALKTITLQSNKVHLDAPVSIDSRNLPKAKGFTYAPSGLRNVHFAQKGFERKLGRKAIAKISSSAGTGSSIPYLNPWHRSTADTLQSHHQTVRAHISARRSILPLVDVHAEDAPAATSTSAAAHEAAEFNIDQLVDERLKIHAVEMRAILEEALKQKRPIFNLRVFEGRFFSPQMTNGEGEDESTMSWKATGVNGLRDGLKFTVKTLTSLAISGALLFASNSVGHMIRPDVVPAPTTVFNAIASQLRKMEMEVSPEGVKIKSGEEKNADDEEVKRLLEDIGGSSAPISKQKQLVKYLELKYSEGLLSGVPLIKASVLEKLKSRVKLNEEGLTHRLTHVVGQTFSEHGPGPSMASPKPH